MPVGIESYKEKHFQGFENCEETIKFTLFINNLFDALNRKFSAEGIKEKSNDLEVLLKMYAVC